MAINTTKESLEKHHKNNIEITKSSSIDNYGSNDDVPIPYVTLLTENYRCHANILRFPSDNFYGGELVAKGDQFEHDTVPVLTFYTARGVDCWVEESLGYYNDAEVAELVTRIEELVLLSPKSWRKCIGVLTPYHDQV